MKKKKKKKKKKDGPTTARGLFFCGGLVDFPHVRCFLYLVNYSRMKPEIALKALPTLINVSDVPE